MMKKMLAFACAAVLLAGCGESNEPVKKTCTIDNQGMNATMIMEGEGDTLTKASLEFKVSYDMMGIPEDQAAALSEEEKKEAGETMKSTMLASLDLEEGDGYDIASEFNDEGYILKVSAEASIFEKTLDASSVDELTKELESVGYTCK